MAAAGRLTAVDIGGLVLAALLWALCFPFIGLGLPDAPPLLFAALRAGLAAAMLMAVLVLRGDRRLPDAHSLRSLALIGLTFTAVGLGGMFLGAGKVPTGIATVIANVQPLVATLLGIWFLKEEMSGRVATGLLLGLAGVAILASPGIAPDGGPRFEGSTYVLIGAAGTAIGNVLLKRHADRGGGICMAMAIQLSIGAVLLAAASLAVGESWSISWNWRFAGSLLFLSALVTALVNVLWYALLTRLPLATVNSVTYLTPAFGLMIGALFLGERFGIVELGGILVSTAGISLVLSRAHDQPPARD